MSQSFSYFGMHHDNTSTPILTVYNEEFFDKCNDGEILNDVMYEAILNKQYETIDIMLKRKIFDVNSEIYLPDPKCAVPGNLLFHPKAYLTNVRSLLLEDKDINLFKILAKYDKITYEEQKNIFKEAGFLKEFLTYGPNIGNDPEYIEKYHNNFLFLLQFCDLIGHPIDLKKSYVWENDLLTIVEHSLFHRDNFAAPALRYFGITKRDILRKGYLPNTIDRFRARIDQELKRIYG